MKPIIAILIAGFLAGCASPHKASLMDRLSDSDAIVVLRLDARKPAKAEIFKCTVEKTLHGPKSPDAITLSFLHFPDCQRLRVGQRYLCAVRHGSGASYTLIRSDMLADGNDTNLYTCAWEQDSTAANNVKRSVQRHPVRHAPVRGKDSF